MAARLPFFATLMPMPLPEGGGADRYEGGAPLQISTEEVGRIMQARRLNRTSLIGPKGYGRPVEPRVASPAKSVDPSESRTEIERVKALVDGLPDVREDRVQLLKAQVESGTYNVSSDDIADLIVRRAWADSMR
jgi:flagellar biosynthesis anti-sigma factor FlgM